MRIVRARCGRGRDGHSAPTASDNRPSRCGFLTGPTLALQPSLQGRRDLRSQLRRACQRGGLAAFALAAGATTPATSAPSPSPADDTVALSIDASKPGAKIDRNIFGQFAEHLGTRVYEGVWVGPDSPIPNTRGLGNDVVAALKALKVPNVRWPGGCFADEYHWRNGIGPNRPATLNPNWGGVIEPNSFGTHRVLLLAEPHGRVWGAW